MAMHADTDPENWNGFRDDYMQFDEDDPVIDPVQHLRDEDELIGADQDDDDANTDGEFIQLFDGLTPYQRGVADVVGDFATDVMGGRNGHS